MEKNTSKSESPYEGLMETVSDDEVIALLRTYPANSRISDIEAWDAFVAESVLESVFARPKPLKGFKETTH